MKTLKITPQEFEKLYPSKMDCSLPFFQDEWDEPGIATAINIHEDGTLTYDIEGANNIGSYTWSWDGQDGTERTLENIELLVLAGRLLNGMEVRYITYDMSVLVKQFDWDFDSENDYQRFLRFPEAYMENRLPNEVERMSPSALKDWVIQNVPSLSSYESFVKSSEVNLRIDKKGNVTYLSGPRESDWSQADAYVPAGDNLMIVQDLMKLESTSL